MDQFDDRIKAKAKLEPIFLPEGFEERNDQLIKGLDAPIISKRTFKIPVFRFFRSPVIAAFMIVVLSCSAAAAYTLSGGDFFKQFFEDKANNDAGNDYNYMNTEQLNDMASSTVGTVVGTEYLTIDVMGVIVSGNTAKIMLRVTANQLDSVLYDNGMEPLENYRFHDAVSGSLFNDFEMGSIGYYYSDKNENLAPNQFEILYTLIGKGDFEKAQYTIELKDFGYFDFSREDQFAPLYSGSWQFNVAFDPDSDTSKSLFIDKNIMIGGYSFSLNSVNITPLACTINLKCNEGDEVYLDKHITEIFKTFNEESKDCSLMLANGTTLSSGQFDVSPSGGAEGFTLILVFNGPITVDSIVSLSLFGIEYSLNQ
ncbi:hypothetical protein [Sinanaerobacter chloroacetimidivorans]|uniref:DUF4179 domain-containing protein n=1 Tax=Sinanaerobacter chloroacetimidivorans TaxID=2818044 RepID=A0A8J7VX44_9FIRM|nr:hypothetical protein [Sinanaerobacter chloroacetimidivorans]MBR0596672.1 hypothetical protein [Sinanaerobacter chloroacetimidivorans]